MPEYPLTRPDLSRSLRAFAALMAYLVAVKLIIVAVGTEAAGFRSPSQAGVFGWLSILMLTLVGSGAVWVGSKVGMPGVWPADVPLRNRLVLPAILGGLFGALSVGVDRITHWTTISAAQMGVPSIHIAWPASLLIYPGGAIIVNVLYYLVPITLVVGLGSLLARTDRTKARMYWIAGGLAAAIEPATQAGSIGLGTTLAAVFFVQDYAFNLAQVWTFRRAGFGASIVLRVAMYLIWHVLYGVLG